MSHQQNCYDYKKLTVKRLKSKCVDTCKIESCKGTIGKLNTTTLESENVTTNKLNVTDLAELNKLQLNQDSVVLTVGQDKDFSTLKEALDSLRDCLLFDTEIRLDSGEYDATTIEGYIPMRGPSSLKITGDERSIAGSSYVQNGKVFLTVPPIEFEISITEDNGDQVIEIIEDIFDKNIPIDVENKGLVIGDRVTLYVSGESSSVTNTIVNYVDGTKFKVGTVLPLSPLHKGTTITFSPNVTLLTGDGIETRVRFSESATLSGFLIKPKEAGQYPGPLIQMFARDDSIVNINKVVCDVTQEDVEMQAILWANKGSEINVDLMTGLTGGFNFGGGLDGYILTEIPATLANLYIVNPQVVSINANDDLDLARGKEAGGFFFSDPQGTVISATYNVNEFKFEGINVWNCDHIVLRVAFSKIEGSGLNLNKVKTGLDLTTVSSVYISGFDDFTVIDGCETGFSIDGATTLYIPSQAKILDFSNAAFKASNGSKIVLKDTDLSGNPGSVDYCVDADTSVIILNGQSVGETGCT